MKILGINNPLRHIFDPERLPCRLTFGAMPISTTVVADKHSSTTIALVFMPTQSGGSTQTQVVEGVQYPRIRLVFFDKITTKLLNNLRQFKRGFHGIIYRDKACRADYEVAC